MRCSALVFVAAVVATLVTGCAATGGAATDETAGENAGADFPRTIPLDGVVTYTGLNTDAQQGGTDRSEPPAGATDLMEKAFTGAPQANWIYRDETFAVSTLDNRGCAPAPRSIEVLSAHSIVVNLGQEPCTFEYYEGPYTSELDLPAEVTGRPVTVAFRFLDETKYPVPDPPEAAELLQQSELG